MTKQRQTRFEWAVYTAEPRPFLLLIPNCQLQHSLSFVISFEAAARKGRRFHLQRVSKSHTLHTCPFRTPLLCVGLAFVSSGWYFCFNNMSECPRWRKNWSIKEYGEHGNGLWTNQSHSVGAYSTGLARAWMVEWLTPKNESIHFVVLKKCKGKKSILTYFIKYVKIQYKIKNNHLEGQNKLAEVGTPVGSSFIHWMVRNGSCWFLKKKKKIQCWHM